MDLADDSRGLRGRLRSSQRHLEPPSANYKWTALFISTLGMLMATIDGSITLIALPDIFRGIGIDPLEPGNSFYLLWMILGFLVVTSVLVVTLGRLGRHLRPGPHLQPRVRRLHVLLAAAHRHLDDRARRRRSG